MNLPTISKIEIFPVRPCQGLIGFASFILNESFAVTGVGIHTRPDGSLRLLYPNKKLPNGLEIGLFYPINQKVGEFITQQISLNLSLFKKEVAKDESGKRKYIR